MANKKEVGVGSSSCNSSSNSKPINNTRFRRFIVLAAIKLLRNFQDRSNAVLSLTPNICVKLGTFRDLAEASTMQFIAQHTSIPVPKVYCSFTRKGNTYIVMQKIRGKMAAVAWANLSSEARTEVLLQLRKMIDEMRQIPSTDQRIANVDGGSLWDSRVCCSIGRWGPFKNTQDFHAFLRDQLTKGPPEHPG